MAIRDGTSGPKLKNWFELAGRWLRQFRPRFGRWQFWAVLGLVLVLAVAHAIFENMGYFAHLGRLYFVPISLFFVPVVLAAISFGFAGSVATAILVIVVSIPNLAIWHTGLERLGEIFQMGVLLLVAAFLGQRVDRETSARNRAQAATAALRTYAAYVIRAQEEERQRIARELHDDTIQTLALLCRRLDSAESASQSRSPLVAEEIREARKITEQAVKDLRDFARTLRPPTLDDLGILPSLRRLVADFTERTGTKGQLDVIGEERRLMRDAELGLFRIAQEALRNVEYHSKATEVAVTLTFAKRETRLEVTDNGTGFNVPPDLDGRSGSGQLGLLGMRERAELLDGRFEVRSSPQRGTTVTVSLPGEGTPESSVPPRT